MCVRAGCGCGAARRRAGAARRFKPARRREAIACAAPSPRRRRWGILYMAQMNPLVKPVLGASLRALKALCSLHSGE